MSKLIDSINRLRTIYNKAPSNQRDAELINSLVDSITINKTLENNLFLYKTKQSNVLLTLINNANNVSVYVDSEQPKIKESTKSNKALFAISGLISIIASTLIFKHFSGFKIPELKWPNLTHRILESNINIFKESNKIDSKELDSILKDYPGLKLTEADTEDVESIEDKGTILEQALERINAAKAGLNVVTDNIVFHTQKALKTFKALAGFVINMTPFGIVNLLLGKFAPNIMSMVKGNIESLTNKIWNSASEYITDLFKWITLKELVSPVDGLKSGFISFIGKNFVNITKREAHNDSDKSSILSSVLSATSTIYSGLTSSLVRINPDNFETETPLVKPIEHKNNPRAKNAQGSSSPAGTETDSAESNETVESHGESVSSVPGNPNHPMLQKAIQIVMKRAHAKSKGRCAQYTRQALQMAGFKFNHKPSAYQYHDTKCLAPAGFKHVSSGTWDGGYPKNLLPGDVIIWPKNPPRARHKHHHGHISLTVNSSGKQYSDFNQPRFASSINYLGAPYHVWRFVSGNSTSQTNARMRPDSPGSSKVTAANKPTPLLTGKGGESPDATNDEYPEIYQHGENCSCGLHSKPSKKNLNNYSAFTSSVATEPKSDPVNDLLSDITEFVNSKIVKLADEHQEVYIDYHLNDDGTFTYQVIDTNNRQDLNHNKPRQNQQLPVSNKQTTGIEPNKPTPRKTEHSKSVLDLLFEADQLGTMGIY